MVAPRKLRKASETNARRIAARQRAARILRLRKRGFTYREIAKKLSMSHTGVAKSLHKSLAELRDERLSLSADVLDLELSRLDDIIRKMRKAIDALSRDIDCGDDKTRPAYLDVHKPAAQLLKAIEQRARLLGLYAPVEVALTTHEDALKELE